MTDRLQENDVVALLVDIPERGLHPGDTGTVIQIVAPTRNDSGWILLEFVKGGLVTQTDVDNADDLVKLNFCHKQTSAAGHEQTLEEWTHGSHFLVLVFTDIVNSTSLANESGDEKWISMLRKHFDQARGLMAKYAHYEIKIIGDSFMVLFRSVLDALDFAIALHENTGDERIRIRAGIHVGEPQIFGNDIFGNMVNYTKRVESAEENKGGIRLSDAAMKVINDAKAQRHAAFDFIEKRIPFNGYTNAQTIFEAQERHSFKKVLRQSFKKSMSE
jgi:class 3 adenylate cyclase